MASSAWLVTTMSACAGRLPGLLGEAAGAERAALRPDAFRRGHRDLPPGPVVHPGHQLVAVTGAGPVGPLGQPLHLPADRGHRARVEQHVRRVLGRTGAEPVQAQVVAAALEDGEHRLAAEQRGQRVAEPGQVAVDQLALQRDGRGGHHHRRAASPSSARPRAPGRPVTSRSRCRPGPRGARRPASSARPLRPSSPGRAVPRRRCQPRRRPAAVSCPAGPRRPASGLRPGPARARQWGARSARYR